MVDCKANVQKRNNKLMLKAPGEAVVWRLDSHNILK